jgi:hypothetical protein
MSPRVPCVRHNAQQLEFRLVAIETASMRVLTTLFPRSISLPRVSVPAGSRLTKALTETVEREVGLRTLELALLPAYNAGPQCTVHEILAPQASLKAPFAFTDLNEISSEELTGEERSLVLKIMKSEAHELGRFARIGWLGDLYQKAHIPFDRTSFALVKQLNQGINFSLLRLQDAEGHPVWFKSVGKPNQREYSISLKLSQRFPKFLPKIVAEIPEWNGWIMEEVLGTPLNESEGMRSSEQALAALALMQKEMARETAVLSELGALDWTSARISALSEPFFSEAHLAMQAQTSTRSKPIPDNDLDQLNRDMDSALSAFNDSGIPDTLVHGDIGHGNIIATANGPIFLDWAETCIGHPFLSAEHLLADLARSQPLFSEARAILRAHYVSHWSTYASPSSLAKTAALAPAIAAFAYAIFLWEANRDQDDPEGAWPILRSMLRRTRRELSSALEAIL